LPQFAPTARLTPPPHQQRNGWQPTGIAATCHPPPCATARAMPAPAPAFYCILCHLRVPPPRPYPRPPFTAARTLPACTVCHTALPCRLPQRRSVYLRLPVVVWTALLDVVCGRTRNITAAFNAAMTHACIFFTFAARRIFCGCIPVRSCGWFLCVAVRWQFRYQFASMPLTWVLDYTLFGSPPIPPTHSRLRCVFVTWLYYRNIPLFQPAAFLQPLPADTAFTAPDLGLTVPFPTFSAFTPPATSYYLHAVRTHCCLPPPRSCYPTHATLLPVPAYTPYRFTCMDVTVLHC